MSNSVFSVPISVLLGLVENLVDRGALPEDTLVEGGEESEAEKEDVARRKNLIKRMRMQIWAGAGVGLLIALCIGAAFIAVFFTTLNDIWSKTEEIWEGTFSLIACFIILVMGLTMLRIDRSKVKWQQKLEGAFDKKAEDGETDLDKKEGKSGKWALFLLPMITVLREGLEAVVFVGGVSLGQGAKSIPLAAVVGIACGLIIGYLIYASSSRLNLSIFLIVSTNVLFLLGAGLFSKAVGDFERYKFNKGVGADVGELGSGPGSYDVRGNVWHLDYGNPENNTSGSGWSVFNAILGWTNNASIGTILSYVAYWVFVIFCLVYMKWSEGRTKVFGYESAAAKRRTARQEAKASQGSSNTDLSKTHSVPSSKGSDEKEERPEREESHELPIVV
ncbi:high-affinity iron transporter, partial [Phenoliferia sp. Uapishka_3]